MPSDFLSAIRSLCEFRYLAQAPSFTDGAVAKLERALKDFHSQKDAVLISGARRGKSGEDKPWAIPKLELLQGVAPSIRSHGSPMQWSADPTERAHIDYIKIPGRAGNKHDYDEQICRHLDRQEKCENFTLAMKIKLGEDLNKEDEDDHENASVSNGGARQISDYFQRAQQLEEGIYIGANPPKPFRTFATSVTAYHLNNAPTLTNMTIDGAAETFLLDDLRAALGDYLERDATAVHVIGGRRRAPPNCNLPFERIQVWCKVRMQLKSYHEQRLEPSQVIHAQPPSEAWPHGRYDAVIVNVDPKFKWPHSHLEGFFHFFFSYLLSSLIILSGHCIGHVRLIFRPITPLELSNTYFAYVQRLDIVAVDPAAGMHIVKRAQHSNGARIGDVIPLNKIVSPAHLIPRFGPHADPRLTLATSNEFSTDFFLNKFWNKEFFFSIDGPE